MGFNSGFKGLMQYPNHTTATDFFIKVIGFKLTEVLRLSVITTMVIEAWLDQVSLPRVFVS